MTKFLKERKRGQFWTLWGYSLAILSVFTPNDGFWRKTLLSLGILTVAVALAAMVGVRRMRACSTGAHE